MFWVFSHIIRVLLAPPGEGGVVVLALIGLTVMVGYTINYVIPEIILSSYRFYGLYHNDRKKKNLKRLMKLVL